MPVQAVGSRNQFKGTIKEIVPGPLVSEVDVETPAGTITSVITSRSISDLKLRVGSEGEAGNAQDRDGDRIKRMRDIVRSAGRSRYWTVVRREFSC